MSKKINFTENEKSTFIKVVNSNLCVFDSNKSSAALKEKEEAWMKITHEFNQKIDETREV